ncbi:MAG: gliding motility-associated C-terminal domain-containing protein [Bacteroidota bacterium]
MEKLYKFTGSLMLAILMIAAFMSACKRDKDTVSFHSDGKGYYYNDSATRMVFPGAFTPNGDGINDIYHFSVMNVFDFSLKIVDSTGATLYTWVDTAQRWDGRNLQGQIKQGYYKAKIGFKTFGGTIISKDLVFILFYAGPTASCLTKDAKECNFPDMIEPGHGFVYQTQETFCN